MTAFTMKFLNENLPFVSALKKVFPVWKHLVFHYAAFTSEISKANKLSFKNAALFAVASAILLTSIVFMIDQFLQIYLKFFVKAAASYTEFTKFNLVLFELGFTLLLFFGSFGTASAVYISSLLVIRRTSFKRLFISSLYVGTFLNTIHFAMLLVFLGLVVILGTHQKITSMFNTEELSMYLQLDLHPVVKAWRLVVQVWNSLVIPVVTVYTHMRITGLSLPRIMAGMCLLLVVVGGCAYVVMEFLGPLEEVLPGPVPV